MVLNAFSDHACVVYKYFLIYIHEFKKSLETSACLFTRPTYVTITSNHVNYNEKSIELTTINFVYVFEAIVDT